MTAQQLVTGNDSAASDVRNEANIDARDAVLNMPELLDVILSFLPSHDILVHAQRVGKQWKTATATSPTIQTKLRLRSQASKPVSPSGTVTDLAITIKEGFQRYLRLDEDMPLYKVTVGHNDFFKEARTYKPPLVPTHFGLDGSVAHSPTYHRFVISNMNHALSVVQPS